MAVFSYREVLPRTFSHKFGESPTSEIKYHVTTDGPTATQLVIDAVGISHGSAHPEYGYLLCTNAVLNELDRFHVEVTYTFDLPATGTANSSPNPLARNDVWSFSTGGAAVPALVYYHGTGNNDLRPLINTAGDFLESAMTEESELRATISGNRSSFPAATALQVTNALNSDSYLGAAAHQWKCSGISGQQQVEVVGGDEIVYWSISVELSFRQSGWKLLLPNVGWNAWSQSQSKKIRAYVIDNATKEEVPSANPLALNEDGTIRLSSDLQGSGRPDILQRRVHREVAFAPLFGVPPF